VNERPVDRGWHFADASFGDSLVENSTKKNLILGSGYVTKWYQSMVTTLGLIGLMNELRINSVRSTPTRSNSPNLTLLSRIKNLENENPTVYACERIMNLCANYKNEFNS
jgi:hypothetical protein